MLFIISLGIGFICGAVLLGVVLLLDKHARQQLSRTPLQSQLGSATSHWNLEDPRLLS